MITEFKMEFKREGDKAVINGYIEDDKLPEWRFELKNIFVDSLILDCGKIEPLHFIELELTTCINHLIEAYKKQKKELS